MSIEFILPPDPPRRPKLRIVTEAGPPLPIILRPVGGVIACVLIGLALAGLMLWKMGGLSPVGSDFFYALCSARLVLAGHGSHIYDPVMLGHLERQLAYPGIVPGGSIPNPYPGIFAVALVPLALLPLKTAYLVWLAINCVFLGVSIFFLEQYARLAPRGRAFFRHLSIISLPAAAALLQGQMSCLLLALFTGSFFATRRGHPYLAGGLLAFTIIKPQYTAPFLLVYLLRGKWRTVATFAGVASILALIPIPFIGLRTVIDYPNVARQAAGWASNVGGFGPDVNRSFAGFTHLLLPAGQAGIATVALDLMALTLLVVVTARARSFDRCFGLATVVAVLVSQHALNHDLTLLVIPAAIALRYQLLPTLYAGLVLIGIELALTVGVKLAGPTPVQFPTLAVCALGIYLVLSGRNKPARAGTAPANLAVSPQASPTE
ncbi:MAG: glycosyltransferase family 87 protein [Chloroflexota bacterium]